MDEVKQWVLAMFPYMPNFELQGTVVLVGGKHEMPTEVQIEKEGEYSYISSGYSY